jgi:hypothetical protein
MLSCVLRERISPYVNPDKASKQVKSISAKSGIAINDDIV